MVAVNDIGKRSVRSKTKKQVLVITPPHVTHSRNDTVVAAHVLPHSAHETQASETESMQGLGANLHNRNKVKKTFDLAPHRVHLGWGQRKVCQPCEVLDSGLCHWGCFSTLAACAARHQLLHGPLSLWRYLRVDQRRWVSVIHSPTMCIQHAHHRIGLSRRTRTQERREVQRAYHCWHTPSRGPSGHTSVTA